MSKWVSLDRSEASGLSRYVRCCTDIGHPLNLTSAPPLSRTNCPAQSSHQGTNSGHRPKHRPGFSNTCRSSPERRSQESFRCSLAHRRCSFCRCCLGFGRGGCRSAHNCFAETGIPCLPTKDRPFARTTGRLTTFPFQLPVHHAAVSSAHSTPAQIRLPHPEGPRPPTRLISDTCWPLISVGEATMSSGLMAVITVRGPDTLAQIAVVSNRPTRRRFVTSLSQTDKETRRRLIGR
jgi:hypothetical protein